MPLRRGLRTTWVAVLLTSAATSSAAAQKGGVTGVATVQSLDFGQMQPGVQHSVAVNDGWRRAVLRLDGSGQVAVRFTLPTQLVSSSGATLPLQFGTTDGEVEMSKSGKLSTFDPNAGTKVNLTAAGGVAWVYLGGLAIPAPLQRAGSYTATIVIVVAPPNL